jgi:hypothetical protein
MPAAQVAAQSDEIDEDENANLIEPEIERVEFDESQIDSYDFELAIYAGALALENFDTNPVVGLKLGYHVSEDFFVQGSYGVSDSGKTSYEKLSGGAPLLSDSEREVEYYIFAIGDDRSTIALAVGYRTIFIDGFSLDVEMRDLIFDMDIFGEDDDTTHNLELTLSANIFF